MNGEIELGGVYLPPLLLWACLAVAPYALVRKALIGAGLYRLIWHRALFDIALFIVLTGAIDALSSHFSRL